jgi:hypothetical protein
MDNERSHGERVAGRILYQTEAVGVVALVLSVVAVLKTEGDLEWFAGAAFLLVAAVAFGLLANAVLRR